MSLKVAIAQLQAQIATQGTKQQPKEGETEWYLYRAAAIGLAWLQQADRDGLGQNPRAVEVSYKLALKEAKKRERDAADETGISP